MGSSPFVQMDFKRGIESISYAGEPSREVGTNPQRPILSEKPVPSRLAALFNGRSVDDFLMQSLDPKGRTGTLLGNDSIGGHLKNVASRLRDLREAYPRRDEAFQQALAQLEEEQQNHELLTAMRRTMIAG